MLEDEPRKYTGKEVDDARHEGFKQAEALYSKQNLVIENKQLKEEIKKLTNQ